MLNLEYLFFKNQINKQNQDSYLIRVLSQSLLQISIPAVIVRMTSGRIIRGVFLMLGAYYIGFTFRKINDDLIEYGKNYNKINDDCIKITNSQSQ